MAQKLTDLEVKEVSFCKQGAVPGAKISIFKSTDPVDPKETSLIQKAVEAVAKTFGLVAKEEKPPEPVKKGAFAEAWTAEEMRSNFYDAFWTLDDVIWSIINDTTITDKSAAIATAAKEFADMLPRILNVDVQEVNKMAEIRKSLVLPARSQIEKAFEQIAKSQTNKEDEDMALTAEERQALVTDVTKAVTEGLNLSEVVKSAVAEAIKPVQEDVAKTNAKVEEIGKMAGGSQQPEGQEPAPGAAPVAKAGEAGFWNGVL